jgi:hypothetical protein
MDLTAQYSTENCHQRLKTRLAYEKNWNALMYYFKESYEKSLFLTLESRI